MRLASRPSWTDVGSVLLLFAVALLLQGLQGENYFDGDTGYHLAVAHYTLEHGILEAFPWTPFSWLGEHYADKELLFHLLLVPLAPLEPNLAARLAGMLLGGILLGTLYAVLRAERVEHPLLWTLLVLACSAAFTHRFVLVRPHVLSIALALVVLWAGARGRWRVLALAGFLFPLAYTAWHLPLALAGLGAAARLVARARPWWPGPPVAGAAVAMGVLAHPNFPQNLSFFWIQNVEVLFQTAWADRPGFELGGEFEPLSAFGLLRYALLPAAFTAAALAVQARRRDPLGAAAGAAALGMAVMTLQSQRFVEYWAPFAVLALALSCPPGLLARAPEGLRRRAPALLLAGALAWTALLGRPALAMLEGRSVLFPGRAEAVARELVPRGAQVFHCDWKTVGEMMLALPDRRFLFALDPVLFYRGDPEAYRLWYELLHRPRPAPADALREAFGADYVLCDQRARWRPFLATLERDPEVWGPAEIGPVRLYKVVPEGTDASSARRE